VIEENKRGKGYTHQCGGSRHSSRASRMIPAWPIIYYCRDNRMWMDVAMTMVVVVMVTTVSTECAIGRSNVVVGWIVSLTWAITVMYNRTRSAAVVIVFVVADTISSVLADTSLGRVGVAETHVYGCRWVASLENGVQSLN